MFGAGGVITEAEPSLKSGKSCSHLKYYQKVIIKETSYGKTQRGKSKNQNCLCRIVSMEKISQHNKINRKRIHQGAQSSFLWVVL